MKKFTEVVSSETLSNLIVEGMLEMKASDVQIFDLRDIKHSVADFFVICSGNSDTHIDSISQLIEKNVFEKSRQKPWKKEGF